MQSASEYLAQTIQTLQSTTQHRPCTETRALAAHMLSQEHGGSSEELEASIICADGCACAGK
jgi:hypothetical protein